MIELNVSFGPLNFLFFAAEPVFEMVDFVGIFGRASVFVNKSFDLLVVCLIYFDLGFPFLLQFLELFLVIFNFLELFLKNILNLFFVLGRKLFFLLLEIFLYFFYPLIVLFPDILQNPFLGV